jgi:CheY-like chemotaxis protein
MPHGISIWPTGIKTVEKAVVLVVEDEALIRMGAVQMVEEAGFAVLEACDAEEAIRILQNRPDIRAVFTDINMSGSMDGLQLSHAIRGRWPPIHLILTSGLNVANGKQIPTNARFISKPYTAEHIAAALRELFFDPNQSPSNSNNESGGSRKMVA